MSIQAKPYNPADNLIKSVFLGHPNIFADVDFNRQIDLQDNVDAHLTRMVGGRWPVAAANPLNIVAGYDSDGYLTWSCAAYGVTYEHRGSLFQFDVELDGEDNVGAYSSLRFYLVGTREQVGFAEAPALCGLVTSVFPDPVAGADVVRWAEGAGVVVALNGAMPALGPNEEIITCLAVIAPEPQLVPSNEDYHFQPVVTYDSTPDNMMKELLDELPGQGSPKPNLWMAINGLMRWSKLVRADLIVLVVSSIRQFKDAVNDQLLQMNNLITRQKHDRAVVDKFADLAQAPQWRPTAFEDYRSANPDDVLAQYMVPVGPTRNYIVHFTVSFTRITSVAELDMLIIRSADYTSFEIEGRQYNVTDLGGDGAAMTVHCTAMVKNVQPGERLIGALEHRGGNSNQVKVSRATLVLDGVPV